ncbi:hypothetical protein TGARI_262610 [Toxoplasma gondii ARI]|uniref:Transmembrane protein n=1 Tax=Toxoplasma gondii ARI TaxID=1074872 RepID=A0A139XPJ7_TOXGO|nr:hypothetical protein TGARI_262610 [Toxoplasma gondii ARI]
MRAYSGYGRTGSPGGSMPSSGFFASGALGSGGLGSGTLTMTLSHPSGAQGAGGPNNSRSRHTKPRRSSCRTACAVLGFGRVTGVYLFSCLACISVAVAFNTTGPSAYEYYVSCHGDGTVSHGFFLLLVAAQLFFIVLKWWRPQQSAWHWMGAVSGPERSSPPTGLVAAFPLETRTAVPSGKKGRLEQGDIHKGVDPAAVVVSAVRGSGVRTPGGHAQPAAADAGDPSGSAAWMQGGFRLPAGARHAEDDLSQSAQSAQRGAFKKGPDGARELTSSMGMAPMATDTGTSTATGIGTSSAGISKLFLEEAPDGEGYEDRQEYAAGLGDLESGRNGQVFCSGGGDRLVPSWRPTGICWNSTWVTMEYLIYGLGFYSAVLGWRVYGGATTSNFTTLRTCDHMNVLSFGADLPLVDSIVSDFAFLESYLALATTMLIVRKYRNPYWLSSYCGPGLMRHCPEALKTVFIFQALLQLAILATATGKIALCWMTGYGTPMQILSAFILVSVVMWTVTVLSHVLQTEQMNPPLLPTLEYHWLWAMICQAIIWFCGFLFYLSVYGVRCWPFLALHAAAWLGYVSITVWKFSSIFPNWISGTEETDVSVDASDHRRVLRPRHRGDRSMRVLGDEVGAGASPFMRASYQ